MNEITEVERVAVTLLDTYLPTTTNDGLREWVLRLLADPDYAQMPPETVNALTREAYITEFGGATGRFLYLLDEGVSRLANALLFFRWHGRPAGDQSHRLADGITVTTSLAAAIVEFHQWMIDAHTREASGDLARLAQQD